MTDDTALFELGCEDTTITQTLKVDMTSSENQAWTENYADDVFTLNVKECVWGVRRHNYEKCKSDYVWPAKRETTRSQKVRNGNIRFPKFRNIS